MIDEEVRRDHRARAYARATDVLTEHRDQARRCWPRSSSPRRPSTRRSSRRCSSDLPPKEPLHGVVPRLASVAGGPIGAAGLTHRPPPDVSGRAGPHRDPAVVRLADRRLAHEPGRRRRAGPRSRSATCQNPAMSSTTDRPRGLPRRDRRAPPGPVHGLPADPEHQRDPGARRRTAGGRPSSSPASSPAAGLEHVEVAETGGHPVVYADWLHARRRARPCSSTATTTSSRWTRSSCGRRRRSSRSSGTAGCSAAARRTTRASSTCTSAAAEALLATRGACRSTSASSSRARRSRARSHLDAWLEANRERLAADVAVISDTGFFEGNLPAITIGLRGICYAQIDVTGRPIDLHSGSYGGAVENPANALAEIIAALKGTGRPDPGPRLLRRRRRRSPTLDRAAFAALPVRRGGLPRRARRAGPRRARPATRRSSGWAPGPPWTSTGSGAASRARAPRRSSRPMPTPRSAAGSSPNQDPDDDLRARSATYVAGDRAARRPGRTSVTLGGGEPSLTPIDHPATQAAARALEATFGRAPLYIREGGSIPVAASFESILGLPVVAPRLRAARTATPTRPNEWMVLANFETGIRTIVRLLGRARRAAAGRLRVDGSASAAAGHGAPARASRAGAVC